jgi:lipoprotein NlpI
MRSGTNHLIIRRGLRFKGHSCCLFAPLLFVLFAASEPVTATGKPGTEEGVDKCYKSTNPGIAITYCTRAIESGQLSGKGLAFAFYRRGNAYNEQGDYDRAIDDYNEALQLNPKHANALSNRGVAYGHKGEYDLAIQSYDEALRLNPRHLNALYNRGNAYTRKGEYDRAAQDYDQVLQLNPKHTNAYSSRGFVRFFQGQFTAAVPDFSEAVRFAPNNPYRILLLYIAQARAGNHGREALAHAAQGLDLAKWPGPVVSMYLGKVPEQVVLDSVAEADVTERPQRRCQAYFYIGQQLLIRQRNNEAAKMFRETVATNASALFEYEAAQAELRRLGN